MTFSIILSIVGFVRILLVVLLVWYGVKLVTRYLLPFFLNKTVRNMQSRMEDQIRDRHRNSRREGEVTLENQPRKRDSSIHEGEYVDYEEVE